MVLAQKQSHTRERMTLQNLLLIFTDPQDYSILENF
jgi:hypothetical protein